MLHSWSRTYKCYIWNPKTVEVIKLNLVFFKEYQFYIYFEAPCPRRFRFGQLCKECNMIQDVSSRQPAKSDEQNNNTKYCLLSGFSWRLFPGETELSLRLRLWVAATPFLAIKTIKKTTFCLSGFSWILLLGVREPSNSTTCCAGIPETLLYLPSFPKDLFRWCPKSSSLDSLLR